MKLNSGKELLKGSFILLLLFNVFNLLNLLFQVFTARFLSLESYGILTALLSIIYLFAIFSESIQLTVAKQSTRAKSDAEVKGIYSYACNQCLKISVWLFAIYCVFFLFTHQYLKIPFFLLALNGLAIFFAFLTPVSRGILQGKKNFLGLGTSMIIEGGVKLLAALIFIFIGWEIYGAVGAILLSMVLPFIYARYSQLKNYFQTKSSTKKSFSLLKYGPKVFIIMTFFILFFMLDAFIAKIVFDPTTAGMYAIISVLAKTLFIGTQPISKAFFPLAASEKKGSSGHLFKKAALIVGFCLAIALLVFYFFSDFIISIFSGKDLGPANSALFIVGLANAVLAFVNLILFYRISQENYKNILLFALCVVIQIALLSYFSSSILSFSIAFLVSTVIFLAASLYRIK